MLQRGSLRICQEFWMLIIKIWWGLTGTLKWTELWQMAKIKTFWSFQTQASTMWIAVRIWILTFREQMSIWIQILAVKWVLVVWRKTPTIWIRLWLISGASPENSQPWILTIKWAQLAKINSGQKWRGKGRVRLPVWPRGELNRVAFSGWEAKRKMLAL